MISAYEFTVDNIRENRARVCHLAAKRDLEFVEIVNENSIQFGLMKMDSRFVHASVVIKKPLYQLSVSEE